MYATLTGKSHSSPRRSGVKAMLLAASLVVSANAILPFCCRTGQSLHSGTQVGWSAHEFSRRASKSHLPRRVRESKKDAPDPKVLTSMISQAKSANMLLALVGRNVDTSSFNAFHVSVLFSRRPSSRSLAVSTSMASNNVCCRVS